MNNLQGSISLNERIFMRSKLITFARNLIFFHFTVSTQLCKNLMVNEI